MFGLTVAGFAWGIVAALVIALLIGFGLQSIALGIVVFVIVAVMATVVEGFRARARTPRFRLLGAETVPWTVINGTRMSWCRFEIVNDGTPGTVAIQLTAVRPHLQINGLGHNLRGMGRPVTEDGSVMLQTGQHQKFDLFWMGKRAGKQYNVSRDVHIQGRLVAARLVKTELESILARVLRLRISPILTEDYLLPTTEWTSRRAELAQTASYDDAVGAYREVDRVNDQWRWRKEGANGRIAANMSADGLENLERAATQAVAALNQLPTALRREAPLPGPRRLFMYGVCLKDGGADLEPVNPQHRRYEFDVTIVGGPKRINATSEVCITPNAGPKITFRDSA
jgi:hypothetical protein